MKSILRVLKLIAAVVAGFADVKIHLDRVTEFLQFFAENRHAEGYVWVREGPHVRPLFEKLSAEQQAACDLAGPLIFEWIDVALPEEPILAFLKKIQQALA